MRTGKASQQRRNDKSGTDRKQNFEKEKEHGRSVRNNAASVNWQNLGRMGVRRTVVSVASEPSAS